jgi:FKBP-type peptidyl-prolyl cis-trans isomerase FkpA
MTVTATPQQPIAKGSMTKLWVGMAVVALGAGGLAWKGTAEPIAMRGSSEQFLAWHTKQAGVVTTESGLQYKVVKPGEGPKPTAEDMVAVAYKGTLRDGTVFDENPRATFAVQQVVPGFSEVLKLMSRGAKYKVWIPAALGYGDSPPTPAIPAGAVLVFDLELSDFKSIAEIQAMQQAQQKGGQPGAPEQPQQQ